MTTSSANSMPAPESQPEPQLVQAAIHILQAKLLVRRELMRSLPLAQAHILRITATNLGETIRLLLKLGRASKSALGPTCKDSDERGCAS